MLVFALFLLVIGTERVMLSERWPQLDGVRRRWNHWSPKAKAYMRSAPGTFTYLFVLVITTWVLQTSSSKIANELLLARSTNLHHLFGDPMRVLFGSAFWVSSGEELLFTILIFSLIVAQVERWLGTARTVVIFFLGHVGATVIVALWLWASLNFTYVKSPITNAQDVGASYGFAALAAILAFRISLPRRWLYITVVLAIAGIDLTLEPSFTNWGHAIAVALGFISYFFIPRRFRIRRLASEVQ
ncbi:MAG TPA: rhomboid-like protein [Candidatus Nanopelagicaceae bacterium]